MFSGIKTESNPIGSIKTEPSVDIKTLDEQIAKKESRYKKWLEETRQWSQNTPGIDLERDATFIATRNKLEAKIQQKKMIREKIMRDNKF